MTKLTKAEQELARDLDAALGTPPKFSSREIEGRYRIGIDREVDWLCAVMAAVMTHDPEISQDAMYAEIDARVERAGGSLELAAAAADAEFEEKH